jgi:hypothetical protein
VSVLLLIASTKPSPKVARLIRDARTRCQAPPPDRWIDRVPDQRAAGRLDELRAVEVADAKRGRRCCRRAPGRGGAAQDVSL